MALGALPRAHAQDAIAFAHLDRDVVEVGETVTWTVEAVGHVATDADRHRWVEDLKQLAPDIGGAWAIAEQGAVRVRQTGRVVEVRRSVALRALEAGDHVLPSVPLADDVTPALDVRAHAASPGAEAGTRSVVAVVAEGAVDGHTFRRAGSAFLVGDDALVTAYHVVAGARRVTVQLPSGRRLATREAWVLDPERDVAILHVDGDRARAGGLRALPLAPERDDEAGVAFSGGWPSARGAERQQAVTVGRRYADLDLGDRRVRVSANPVRPGDSGGPLLDARGRVLGVIVSGRSTDGDPDLLRQDVCLAANVLPAVRALTAVSAPVGLRPALRAAAASAPSARALAAVDGVRLGRRPEGYAARVSEAAQRAPDDPVLQFLAGSILEEVGHKAAARGAYEGASRAGYFPAVYALAHHRLRAGDLARADSLFAVVRASGPYAELGAMGAARAYVEQGRYREARRALATVLAHDASFAPALYLLGLTHLADGNEALAEALVVRLARRPSWARALQLPLDVPALRPATLEPLPVVAWRRR